MCVRSCSPMCVRVPQIKTADRNKSVCVHACVFLRHECRQRSREIKFAHINSVSHLYCVLKTFAGHPPLQIGMAQDSYCSLL